MPRPVCRSPVASRAATSLLALATCALVALAPAASARAQPRSATAAPAPAPGATALWVPRSVRRAYANGTRSPDGRPGPRYWQNRARYEITLDVEPARRAVRGRETVTYTNASPDTLRVLVLKLLLNVHKPGAVRLAPATPDYLTAGLQVDSVFVNGASVAWRDDASSTVRPLPLPTPLLPRDSVRLAFAWHYELSRGSGREGMLDSTTAYLAYFYPRVAVYDDAEGWDTMPFTDAHEFYSDFNDYDVTLQVPARTLVWGTGTLANPEAVLRPEPLRRYRASLAADSTIHVATRAELAAGQVTTGAATPGATNRWRFTARGVPDVAFAVGDHYAWDAASVIVDSATRRRASVQAAYNDTAPDFPHMVRFGRDALAWLSRQWPGVPYPYEKTTIVQGSADMEYPMMVNDNSFADTTFARFVAEHELAHTWFPFLMGINETRYGFMDEGWATTFEYLLNQARLGPDRAATFFRQFRVVGWISDPSPAEDVPIITPGDVLGGAALSNNEYGKAALGYLAAKELLGDAAFRTGLHAFIDRWRGRHPLPWDFFATMNDATGRNLDWFWHAWFFAPSYIDVGIAGARAGDGRLELTLENVGGMPAPVDVVVEFGDGTRATVHQTPAIWAADPRRATVTVPAPQPVRAVTLDGGIWMDANAANDRWVAP